MQNVRVRLDMLGIVLSVASLGSATPLLGALAVFDIALSAFDIGVALKEDDLMKSKEAAGNG